MNLKREWIELSEFHDFGTNQIIVKASINFGVAVAINAEDRDFLSEATLLLRAQDQAITTLIKEPENFVRKIGQAVVRVPLKPNMFSPEEPTK